MTPTYTPQVQAAAPPTTYATPTTRAVAPSLEPLPETDLSSMIGGGSQSRAAPYQPPPPSAAQPAAPSAPKYAPPPSTGPSGADVASVPPPASQPVGAGLSALRGKRPMPETNPLAGARSPVSEKFLFLRPPFLPRWTSRSCQSVLIMSPFCFSRHLQSMVEVCHNRLPHL